MIALGEPCQRRAEPAVGLAGFRHRRGHRREEPLRLGHPARQWGAFLDAGMQLGEDGLHAGIQDIVDADRQGAIERQPRFEQNRQLAESVDRGLSRLSIWPRGRLGGGFLRGFHRLDRREPLASQIGQHLAQRGAVQCSGSQGAGGGGRAIAEGRHL